MNNDNLNEAMDKLKKLVELDKIGNVSQKKYNGTFRDRSGLSREEFDKRKNSTRYSYVK